MTFRHRTQRNNVYRPKLAVTIRWTWRRETHYLDMGWFGDKPPFPGRTERGVIGTPVKEN